MSQVKLKSQHLYLEADLVAKLFNDAVQAYIVYYPQKKSLLLAPMTDAFFPKLHKAQLQMLKNRNLKGDKTISLQEIIIDNEIDDTDRDLEFSYAQDAGLLNVTL